MITRYEIKNEDVLILYMDYNYEFGKLGESFKNLAITDQIKDFLNKVKLNFKGKYIVLVIAGLATITLSYNALNKTTTFVPTSGPTFYESYPNYQNMPLDKFLNNQVEVKPENKEVIKDEIIKDNSNTQVENKTQIKNNETVKKKKPTSSITNEKIENKEEIKKENTEIKEDTKKETMVTLYRNNGLIETISLENYLIGVVGSEMPASFNLEALKAQAIVARTYALKRVTEGKVLTDTTTNQVYKDNNILKKLWGNDYNKYYNKVKEAVISTENLVITYKGNLIDAVYHSTSNGYTVDAKDVWGNDIPYLKSVVSTWDTKASSYLRETNKQIEDLNKLGISLNSDSLIQIKKDNNNRVLQVNIDDQAYSGIEFRNMLGLRSTDFDIIINENGLSFTTKGYGHGVGMSQYGANGMANEGYNYKQIIEHYYSNIKIKSLTP